MKNLIKPLLIAAIFCQLTTASANPFRLTSFTASKVFDLASYSTFEGRKLALKDKISIEYQVTFLPAIIRAADLEFTPAMECMSWSTPGTNPDDPGICAETAQVGWHVKSKPIVVAQIHRTIRNFSTGEVWNDQVGDFSTSFYGESVQQTQDTPNSMIGYFNNLVDAPFAHDIEVGPIGSESQVTLRANGTFSTLNKRAPAIRVVINPETKKQSLMWQNPISHIDSIWSLEAKPFRQFAECNGFSANSCRLEIQP